MLLKGPVVFDGHSLLEKGFWTDGLEGKGRARMAGVLNVKLKEFIWNNNQGYQFLPGFLEPPL